jgi:hypothetical protein
MIRLQFNSKAEGGESADMDLGRRQDSCGGKRVQFATEPISF